MASIDLNSLLQLGGDGPDIGDTLTSTTPSGDLLFQKPFGDKTTWRTASGLVTVTVIFDPFLPWSNDNILASTTPNYFQDIRRALGEYLVPDQMAPQVASEEQVTWEKVKSALPAKAFTSFLQEKDENGKLNLTEYLRVIKANVREQFAEDEAIIEAVGTREFLFTYHLAVDSYPQEKQKPERLSRQNSAGSSVAKTKRERLGVLVFVIEGKPDTPLTEDEKSAAKIGIDALDDPEDAGLTPPASPSSQPKQVVPTLRKHRNPKSKKDQKDLEDLLHRLEVDADKLEQGCNEWIKKIPKTTMEFFDQVNTWFSTVIQRKQVQLAAQDDLSKNNSMYH